MKKLGDWLMILLFLGIGAIAGVLGANAVETMVPEDAPLFIVIIVFALFIAFMYVAMALQIAIHEGGHWLFGRMSGYSLVSYRIFSLMWRNENGRLRFSRYSLAGTGGQCLMEPPEYDGGRFPFALYNMGGSLLNLLSSLVFFLLALVFRAQTALWLGLMTLAVVGIGFAVINGVPLRLNLASNDGMNTRELKKDIEARRAFWIQLKISAATAKGKRLREMPEEWFQLPDGEKLGSSLIAALPAFRANRLMDEGRLEDADMLMEVILKNPGAMPGIYKGMLTADRIFCELAGPGRQDRVEALLTGEQKKLMKAMKNQPSILRTQYALAALYEQDGEGARAARNRFEEVAARYPYPQEIEAERELIKRIPTCPEK